MTAPGHLLHGLDRRIPWTEPLLDVMLHCLDDDDRVIDHDANRKDETEQRQHVHRESEHREEHERPDQGNRHGDERDQGRAPALQEDEHHEDDENHGLDQGH